MPVRAIVTDIEGTTTSLSFVKDQLFPYSRERMGRYLHDHEQDPQVQRQIEAVRKELKQDWDLQSITAQLIRWIDEDRKFTPLKALQGMVWKDGYARGELNGHVYQDAALHLQRWKQKGIELYVFSSGSVEAQKLLFGYTDAGDLTQLFNGYFDTNIGQKQDRTAYLAIAMTAGHKPAELLFLSDVPEELDAAKAAGMQTRWVMRDGAIDPTARHVQVRNFHEIHF